MIAPIVLSTRQDVAQIGVKCKTCQGCRVHIRRPIALGMHSVKVRGKVGLDFRG